MSDVLKALLGAAVLVGLGWLLAPMVKSPQSAESAAALDQLKEEVEHLDASLTAKMQRNADTRSRIQDTIAMQELIAAHTELTTSTRVLLDEKVSLEAEYRAAVLKTRAKAVGTKLPELVLSTGKVLQDVTFNAFTGTEVRLSHSAGMQRLPGTELPENLQQKFRYGLPPMLNEVRDVQAQSAPSSPGGPAVAAQTGGAATPGPLEFMPTIPGTPPTAPPEIVPVPTSDLATDHKTGGPEAEALRQKIEANQATITELTKIAKRHRDDAGNNLYYATLARAKGKNDGSFLAQAKRDDAAAVPYEERLKRAEALQTEMITRLSLLEKIKP